MPKAVSPDIDSRAVEEIRRLLLAWYRVHRRDLPWRSDKPDPYHVLVSEAMLQQTQVATVLDYFARFIEAFPTAATLAAADEQQVLKLWQGLGYYRRAKNLHAAAKKIVAEHGGKVPDDPALIAGLPGVGRYTAGAVSSIAFARAEPILDGNVARVLARWFAITKPIDEPATRERLWDLAALLVPRDSAGDFNQGMMELGALVCTPRNPRCLVCPMTLICQAAARGLAEDLPKRLPRRVPKKVEHHIVAIHRDGKFVFEQRPAKGLWAGMWQLPTAETLSGEVAPKRVQAWVKQHVGLAVKLPIESGGLRYQTTHRSLDVRLWMCESPTGKLASPRQWRAFDEIDDLPISNLQTRAIEFLTPPRGTSAGKPSPAAGR